MHYEILHCCGIMPEICLDNKTNMLTISCEKICGHTVSDIPECAIRRWNNEVVDSTLKAGNIPSKLNSTGIDIDIEYSPDGWIKSHFSPCTICGELPEIVIEPWKESSVVRVKCSKCNITVGQIVVCPNHSQEIEYGVIDVIDLWNGVQKRLAAIPPLDQKGEKS